ncbi:SmpA/OmlA [Spiribacter salinus M19-40]|jgi:outer membrane protein assembly factor BamE|uniref:Outer membrane protein assembly factor BamE n=2 Tax=Spiribacter salinus TaxID=1335746 RepID=R4V4Y4_9GAMM|nr:outer membrane protein assembly factor BamE [Spiribacter salinus]MDR9413901.1 outer membrane protein assembly factor BamE [Spiribacter sp.]AGM41009.1 SmpA/OmlA [Spiribacter salinus M19-40]MBY5268239.1 hypothetical protein [Spiribacter salinus]MDR9454940.1 outer membrane protein assembly factor BamE [Spiribacter sp.]TQE99396.1 MAG: outer membrane protein assembly factor BamE [Spiribacter salinus]
MIPVYTGVRAATLLLIMASLVGCAGTIDRLPIVYKPELRQGTAITEAAVEQLEAGMSPRQVRFLLGPPTIEDPFSEGRWDYLYEVEPRSSDLEPVSRRLTVYFDNEQVVAAEGSFIEDGHPLHNSR